MSTPRRYELSDFEWSIIQPLLPNKPRGKPRVDDRRVLNGIYWRLRTGSPWADIPERYGPATTCSNRFRDGRRSGSGIASSKPCRGPTTETCRWSNLSSVRVHQHGGNVKKGVRTPPLPPLGTTLEPSAWGAREAG